MSPGKKFSDLFSLLQFSNVHIPRSAASVRSLNCKKGGWLAIRPVGRMPQARAVWAGQNRSPAGRRQSLILAQTISTDIATAKLMAVQELESCRPPPGMSNSRPKEVCQKLLCQCLQTGEAVGNIISNVDLTDHFLLPNVYVLQLEGIL